MGTEAETVAKLKEENQSLSIHNSTLQAGNQQFVHQVTRLEDRVRELEKISNLHGEIRQVMGELRQVMVHLGALNRDLETWIDQEVVVDTGTSSPFSCPHDGWRITLRHAFGVDVACVGCGGEETDRFSDYPSIAEFGARSRKIVS